MVGFSVASWAPLVPVVKSRGAGMGEAELGLILLCLGLGSLIAMPLSGGWAARFGCRRVISVAASVVCLVMPALGAFTAPVSIGAALLFFGAGIGTLDVVMNIQASLVEQEEGRPMMSGFHGLYSVGGIFGAGVASVLLGLKIAPAGLMLLMAVGSALIIFVARPGLLTQGGSSESPVFAFPKGMVLLIGFMCFVMFLSEGSTLDWSGVLLSERHRMNPSQAGWGYAAFASTMSLGRLTGDRIVARLGGRAILVGGGLLAAVGFMIAAVAPNGWAAIVGFGLVGLGASNVVPVLFTAAGKQNQMPPNLAIAAITTMGYAGILVGPALIGFLARGIGLAPTLAVVAGLIASVPLFAGRILRATQGVG
jgi:predicted MFS family arabinose efflux permease